MKAGLNKKISHLNFEKNENMTMKKNYNKRINWFSLPRRRFDN